MLDVKYKNLRANVLLMLKVNKKKEFLVKDISRLLDYRVPIISKILNKLVDEGLVECNKKYRFYFYKIK
ncbi:MAG: MarR family transcriptional regulator [Candidatus Hermodarchaeota archaeon]